MDLSTSSSDPEPEEGETEDQPSLFPLRLPINTPFTSKMSTSYGIIVYSLKTDRCLLVQRKHSAEFLLILRGIYRLSHLPFLVPNITEEERRLLNRAVKDQTDYVEICLDVGISETDMTYGYLRLQESRQILICLVDTDKPMVNLDLQWTVPKGRLEFSRAESPYDCALREFKEEVELDLPDPIYVSPRSYSHVIETLAGRLLENRYWLYVIPDEFPVSRPENHPEVNDRMWVLIEETFRYLFTRIVIDAVKEFQTFLHLSFSKIDEGFSFTNDLSHLD